MDNHINTHDYVNKLRWRFEKFMKVHKDHNNILDGLLYQKYLGIDAQSKLQQLKIGIKTKFLDITKYYIVALDMIHSYFDSFRTL